jgi:nicotinate-nucleotide adenylyltransferase
MKIGVLGGTFDPVHLGHIGIAEAARDALGLDEVLLVPAGQPVFKTDYPVTPAEHRLAMLRLASRGHRSLKLSTVEVERPGPSYTIDTIVELKRRYGDRAEMYFILGWDSLAQIPGWHEAPGLVAQCYLVAAPRPGTPPPDMNELERKIPGITRKVIFLERPYIDVCATDIRDAAGRGEPIDGLVPAPVAGYIKKHGLYASREKSI